MKANLVAMTGKDSPRWSPMSEDAYFNRAKDLGYEAVALTGITLYSLIPAWKLSKKTGVKLIVGATVYVCEDPESDITACLPMHIYCKDDIGYKALCRVLTESQMHFCVRNDIKIPTVPFNILQKYFGEGADGHGHVIALSGGMEGILTGDLFNGQNDKFLEEKEELINNCERLRGYMAEIGNDLNKAENKKCTLEALSKKDISYREDFLKEEKKKLKKQENPDKDAVDALLKAFEELEVMKKEIQESKAQLKKAVNEVKKLSKQFEALKDQARAITKNKDCDNVTSLEEFVKALKDEISGMTRIGTLNPEKEAGRRMVLYDDLFGHGDFMLEVQKCSEEHAPFLKKLCDTALENGIQPVATNNVTRLLKEDKDLYSTVLYKEVKEWRNAKEDDYFMPDEQMIEALEGSVGKVLAAIAMKNRNFVAENCNVEFDSPERHFPSYAGEELNDDIEKEIAELVEVAVS